MKRLLIAAALVFAFACDRRPVSDLPAIQNRLEAVVGRTPLGDFASLTFDPPAKAEWFVVVPAGAAAADFDAAPDFVKAVGAPPQALLGLGEPAMALVSRGKAAVLPLTPAFTTEKVYAKPGRAVNGLKFVRKAGAERSYFILGLD